MGCVSSQVLVCRQEAQKYLTQGYTCFNADEVDAVLKLFLKVSKDRALLLKSSFDEWIDKANSVVRETLQWRYLEKLAMQSNSEFILPSEFLRMIERICLISDTDLQAVLFRSMATEVGPNNQRFFSPSAMRAQSAQFREAMANTTHSDHVLVMQVNRVLAKPPKERSLAPGQSPDLLNIDEYMTILSRSPKVGHTASWARRYFRDVSFGKVWWEHRERVWEAAGGKVHPSYAPFLDPHLAPQLGQAVPMMPPLILDAKAAKRAKKAAKATTPASPGSGFSQIAEAASPGSAGARDASRPQVDPGIGSNHSSVRGSASESPTSRFSHASPPLSPSSATSTSNVRLHPFSLMSKSSPVIHEGAGEFDDTSSRTKRPPKTLPALRTDKKPEYCPGGSPAHSLSSVSPGGRTSPSSGSTKGRSFAPKRSPLARIPSMMPMYVDGDDDGHGIDDGRDNSGGGGCAVETRSSYGEDEDGEDDRTSVGSRHEDSARSPARRRRSGSGSPLAGDRESAAERRARVRSRSRSRGSRSRSRTASPAKRRAALNPWDDPLVFTRRGDGVDVSNPTSLRSPSRRGIL